MISQIFESFSRMNSITQLFIALLVVAGASAKGKCMHEMMAIGKCCKFPMNSNSSMESPGCKKFQEGADSGDKKEKFKSMVCHSECYYKEKGALNDAGELNKAKLLELIDTTLKDHPEFIAPIKAGLDGCIEEAKKKDQREGDKDGGDKCSKIPFKLNMCLMREGIKNCPESKWTNSDECNAAKAKFSTDDCKKN